MQRERSMSEAVAFAAAASRPILLVGSGAHGAAHLLAQVAERFNIPVTTTPSGRGALPEDHAWALPFDFVHHATADLNALLADADAVVAVGCQSTHNGPGGFALAAPADRLVCVNTDPDAFIHVSARYAVVADAGDFLGSLAAVRESATAWSLHELSAWRARFQTGAKRRSHPPEPVIRGSSSGEAAQALQLLRGVLPRDAIIVTDSGRHQYAVRRHFPVLAPRGLIIPADFQSMGFGIPAGIGAALGNPARPVVAFVGDGGFRMTGFDLATAVREELPLTVIVWNDGGYGLIRAQQLAEYGVRAGVDHPSLDYGALASGLGVNYYRFDGDPGVLHAALNGKAPALVEIRVGESWHQKGVGVIARARSGAGRVPFFRRAVNLLRGSLRGHAAD